MKMALLKAPWIVLQCIVRPKNIGKTQTHHHNNNLQRYLQLATILRRSLHFHIPKTSLFLIVQLQAPIIAAPKLLLTVQCHHQRYLRNIRVAQTILQILQPSIHSQIPFVRPWMKHQKNTRLPCLRTSYTTKCLTIEVEMLPVTRTQQVFHTQKKTLETTNT